MKLICNNGIICETDDEIKIEILLSRGAKKYIEDPKPVQDDVIVQDDFTVKKVVKKTVKKTRKTK